MPGFLGNDITGGNNKDGVWCVVGWAQIEVLNGGGR